ncbi:MAG: hypothetical protein MJ177_03805, partial [Clostridia bacterium]|nr:hypothetical protein [Clostridia bacterium]
MEVKSNGGKMSRTAKTKKEKVTCELFDKMNYICRRYSDRMARMGLTYAFRVDADIFRQVITDLLENVRMFRSGIHSSLFRLYWQTEDYNINDIVYIIETDDPYKAKIDFLSEEIPINGNIQLRIALIYSGESTDICMLWNHMCMDGSAAKIMLCDICSEYDRRVSGMGYGGSFKTGSRKFSNVYSDMDGKTRLKAKLLYNYKAMSGECVFPFNKSACAADSTFITALKIDADIMLKAKAKAKQSGATVNDLAVAAFVYALGRTPGFERKGMIDIMCTVDLRRYLKNPEKLGYTNFSTPFTCFVESREKSFEQTLSDVCRENGITKADPFVGLHGLPLLNLGWNAMIYAQASLIVSALYKNPRLCVSNVGVIKPSEFVLDGREPSDIFVAGPAKDKPYFLINVMSLNGNMLVSSTVKGTPEDKKAVEAFFGEIKSCL